MPIKTTLMVMIIGVTLFLDIVDMNKHKQDMVIMTIFDATNAIINL